MTEPGPDSWAALRSERPLSDGSLVTRAIAWEGKESSILMGMGAEGDLHLLVPVSNPEPGRAIADLNGVRVRLRATEAGRYLDLVAAPQHEMVFSPVCREIVRVVFANGREPWAAVDSIIRQWQAACRPSRPPMSQAVQTGLVGELIVLARVLIPALGSRAVAMWGGPDSERHDFIAGMLHIEVKTTRASRQEHEISRLDQLWAPAGSRLLLASIRLELSIGGTLTLATLIDDVNALIKDDPAMMEELLQKLAQLGWSDEMRRSGEMLRFNLDDAAFYDVDDEFPRLPLGFRPHSGIVAMRYTISLANLPMLDLNEVSDLIAVAAA